MKYDKTIEEMEQETPEQQYKDSVYVIGRGSGKSSLHEKAYQEYLDGLSNDEDIKQQLREEVDNLMLGFSVMAEATDAGARAIVGMGVVHKQAWDALMETQKEEHDTGMNRQEAFGKLLGNDWRTKNRRNYLKGKR